MKKSQERKVSDNQKVIFKFVTNMKGLNNPKIWGREGRLAKTLIDRYGAELLLWMPLPNGYQVDSLMWFFSGPGIHYIDDQRFEYLKATTNLTNQQLSLPLGEKVGEDIKVIKKPQTLKEFLEYGKTITNQERREETTDTNRAA